jgi:hypothetical protein
MDKATRKRMEEALRRTNRNSNVDLRVKTPQPAPAGNGK